MLFSLKGVTASRGGRVVLDGLDLDIDRGATAIVGPSGCGKSTLLRLLNRLADPDAGAITYRGAPITDRDVLELRREVALVPQLPALVEGTVAENVMFGPRLAGREGDVGRALSLAGLGDDFADRDASGLSVGEQQRVMLARSLALEPAVLLLDEPTSALDAAARDAIEATLADLRRRLDTSFVVVTHDPGQARRLAERVVKVG
jgi:putative ABC transport system ATP-binding protein